MSNRHLRVHTVPSSVASEELAGSVVVVIDLLRATSTICQAIASGAREVVPFLEVEEARSAAAAVEDRSAIIMGGERQGERIPGFDLGNSPSEYTADVVGGRRVFITTTNGTRALHHARFARRVIVGSCLNLSAVVASVKKESRVDIVCAGIKGVETHEDILAAGAFADELCSLDGNLRAENITETAEMARRKWSSLKTQAKLAGRTLSDELALALRDTTGGRNLIGIGFDQDLVDCAQIDRLKVVPELDVKMWRIRLA